MANNLNIDSERRDFEEACREAGHRDFAKYRNGDTYQEPWRDAWWRCWKAGAENARRAPLASAPATEPFAWIVVRGITGEWDGGEPVCDKADADHYIENSCLPGWRLEAIYRAPLPPPGEAGELDLPKLRQYLERTSEDTGYGFYRPPNPHDFCPDGEMCSENEIAAHKAACEAYDKGEYTPERGSEWVGKTHILRAPWGMGSYTLRDPDAVELLSQVDAIEASRAALPHSMGKGE